VTWGAILEAQQQVFNNVAWLIVGSLWRSPTLDFMKHFLA
jgi:hypothetical protein